MQRVWQLKKSETAKLNETWLSLILHVKVVRTGIPVLVNGYAVT